jgi:hypothetical protein
MEALDFGSRVKTIEAQRSDLILPGSFLEGHYIEYM